MKLDIPANRAAKKYRASELGRRIAWMIAAAVFFRPSPRPFFGWRRFLLRLFGAKIGEAVNIYSSSVVYYPWNLTVGAFSAIGEDVLIYNLGPVRIGERSSISHRAHLCAGTHDYGRPELPLLKPPIEIGNDAWVCTEAFIGPGVRVGEGSVVGARAVVVKDVDPWTVVAGHPAKFIKRRELTT